MRVSNKTFRRTESCNNEIGFRVFESHSFVISISKYFTWENFSKPSNITFMRWKCEIPQRILQTNEELFWRWINVQNEFPTKKYVLSELIVRFARLGPTKIMYFIANLSSSSLWFRWYRYFIPWLIEYCT